MTNIFQTVLAAIIAAVLLLPFRLRFYDREIWRWAQLIYFAAMLVLLTAYAGYGFGFQHGEWAQRDALYELSNLRPIPDPDRPFLVEHFLPVFPLLMLYFLILVSLMIPFSVHVVNRRSRGEY